MRNPKSKNVGVEVSVSTQHTVSFPAYLHLMNRHLEKEGGTPTDRGEIKEYSCPLDLMRMVIPPELVNEIEEVRLGYAKK